MLKILSFLKKVWGVKKYLQYVNVILNTAYTLYKDLTTISNGGRVDLIDVDKDGIPDIIDKNVKSEKK